MDNKIHIKHYSTPYTDRIRYWVGFYNLIIVSFLIFYLIRNGFDGIVPVIALFLILFIPGLVYQVRNERLYLVDFISDSKDVEIRYFHKKKETTLFTDFDSLAISLKNTTTRGGFNCMIVLKTGNLNFVINNDFDWSFYEMKDLFEYVKRMKKEELSAKDKFNLKMMDKSN